MTTKRWIGNAAGVNDLWTITLSGTVTSQTYTVTINGKSVTYAASGSAAINDVLTGLQTNLGASAIPEFTELTATALPIAGPYTSMTLTGNNPGVPLGLSVSTNGGATFSITNTTAATGPNDFTNAANWSGGAAPANSDTLVFDNGFVNCSYNLNSSLTGVTLSIEPAYGGNIGLPLINSDNNVTYNEYRGTALTFAGGTAIINSAQVRFVNLAFGANTTTVRVQNTGTRSDPNTPVVLIQGGNGSSELDIFKGDVGLAFYQGQTATFPLVKMAYVSQPLSDAVLTVGLGATLTTVSKNGGKLTSRVGATTINQQSSGGSLTLTDAAAVTTLNVYGGTANLSNTGTVATINLYNKSALSFDGDARPKTVTNAINVYSTDVSITDSAKTVNSGVLTVAPAGLASVNVNHGQNTSIVFT